MITATLTETKNSLSALIDRVRQGETILILDRGRPVARLTSVISAEGPSAEGRVLRLERQGILRRAPSSDKSSLFKSPPIRTRHGASALEALLEERRSGR